MAEAPYRNLNRELHKGLTDGKYKKHLTDRGGVNEPINVERKLGLPVQYEVQETPLKMDAFGRIIDMAGTIVSKPAPVTFAPGVV